MQSNRKYRFQKLTPTDDVDMIGYEESLDYVFDSANEDIKNIAMTGVFGSGKSSVIATYEKMHKEKNFLHISLAHFNGVEGEDNDNYVVKIEEKIVNQLIQQINPDSISESSFRIKNKIKIRTKIWWTSLITLLVCFCVYFLSWSKIYEIKEVEACQWLTCTSVTVISLIITVVVLSLFTFSIVNVFLTKKRIKTIKIVDNEIDLDEKEDKEKSFFDQHLDEILYLLVHSNADTIVFEDIDRFEDVDLKVLEHLRELCILANCRLTHTEQKDIHVIRFIYLIRDDIFLQSNDRTKFFDYVIPIIPVVDASNSYNKLKEYLQETGDYTLFNDRFLRGISLYVDDLRIVKNIVNEYQIYSVKLAKTAKNPNKLFALITYKNLLPGDFSKLQSGQGYVYNIFCSKKEIVGKKVKKLNDELEQCKDRIERIKNEKLISETELNVVKQDRASQRGKYSDYDYDKWCQEIYPRRLSIIKEKKDIRENSINARMTEIRKEIAHINNMHIFELITDENEEDVFGVLREKIEDSQSLENEEFKSNEKFIKFLIRNGYIDEKTYLDYMSFFYENGMSLVDKEFLIGLNSHDGKTFDYELDNVEFVLQNLEDDDFMQIETRNFALIDYVLQHDLKGNIEKFVYQMQEKSDYVFIAEYYRITELKKYFVRALCEYWKDAIVSIISSENQQMASEEKQGFLIYCLANCENDIIIEQNKEGKVTYYVENEFVNATCLKSEYKEVVAGLVVLGVKINNLDIQISDLSLRKGIYESDLYLLNKENIYSILKKEYSVRRVKIEGCVLTWIYSDESQPLYHYVKNNINDVMENVVLENSRILDDLKVVRLIIEDQSVEDEITDKYLALLDNRFDNLDDIDSKYWKRIIINRAVEYSGYVVLQYYRAYNLTIELIGFINDSESYIEYKCEDFDEEVYESFWEECYKNNDLSDESYDEIVAQLGHKITTFDINNLSSSKVEILIKHCLIDMTIHNLKIIRKKYSEIIIDFIKSDMEAYISAVNNGGFLEKEILQVIGDGAISNEKKIELISVCSMVISLRDKDYDDDITEYILLNNFDNNDLPYLLTEYKKYSEGVREQIYIKLKSNIPVIKNNIIEFSNNKELLSKVFSDEDIVFNDKISLFELLIENQCHEDLALILQRMNLENLTKLVSGDTSRLPYIKNGKKEVAVLDILKKYCFIEDYAVDGASGTIKVERKKN